MNNMKTFYIEHPNLRIEEAVKIIWKGNENKKNIWWQGQWLTHGELLPLIEFYKQKFANCGFTEGQRIAILLPNCPSFIAIMFATWELGGAICPLNARAGVAQLVDTIKKLDVAFVITTEENAAKASDIRGEVTDIGWGNQIRSYVMQPYTMVKDLRTGEETGNVDAVMDGKLTPFMNAYLKWLSLGCPDRGTRDEE